MRKSVATSRRLLYVALAFLVLASFLFYVWFRISIAWPTEDAVRESIAVSLEGAGCLSVEYPTVLESGVDNQLDFAISALAPLSMTVSVPREIAVGAVTPSSLLLRREVLGTATQLVIPFPISPSSATMAVVTSTATLSLPVTAVTALTSTGTLSPSIASATVLTSTGTPTAFTMKCTSTSIGSEQIYTATVTLANSGLIRGSLAWPETKPQVSVVLELPGREPGSLPIAIETLARAQYRQIVAALGTESILVTLIPALLGLVGWIYIRHQEREKEEAAQKERREADLAAAEKQSAADADEAIEAFRAAATRQKASEAFNAAERLEQSAGRKYVSAEDLDRVESIVRLLKVDLSEALPIDVFFTWPETWAGALMAASTSDQVKHIDSEEAETLRRYARMFPRQLLSAETEAAFRAAQARIGLEPSQAWQWPEPPQGHRLGGSAPRRSISEPLVLGRCNLFPFERADDVAEQQLLFAEDTDWYWPHHPLHEQIMSENRPIAIWGEPGSGKTALGMAAGQYAHAPKTFGCYLSGMPTVKDIQTGLALTLLSFVRSHLTWLCFLDRMGREMIAGVWASTLGKQYALAYLETPARAELRTVPATSVDPQQLIWTAHEVAEARLMQQAVKQLSDDTTLSPEQWFIHFHYCTDRLGFDRRRLVIDVFGRDWRSWPELVPTLNHLVAPGATLQCDVVLLFPDDPTAELSTQNECFDVQQLCWQGDGESHPLDALLRHRCERFGIESFEINQLLSGIRPQLMAAARNPGHLARIWRQMTRSHPSDDRITERTLRDAIAKMPWA